MKSISIFSLILTFAITVYSQPQAPEGYKFEDATDYLKYKEDVIKAMEWLMETPFPEGAAVNKELNGFVISWIQGSPELQVELRLEMLGKMLKKEYKYGPEMMLVYLSGMALAEIKDLPLTRGQKQLVGVHAMLNAYQLVKNEAPFSFLDKMEKRQKKGKLAFWIEQKIR